MNCGLGMRVAAARVVGEAAAVRVGMLAEPAEAAKGAPKKAAAAPPPEEDDDMGLGLFD